MYRYRKVTAIIPALNEAPSIARVIEHLSALSVCQHCFHTSPILVDKADASSIVSNLARNSSLCNNGCCGGTIRLVDDIIVCDNGSTDDTAAVARQSGAIVTTEPERGYGAACLAALATTLSKDLIVFVDADHSIVASELPALIDPLCDGADLVIGSRTLGSCERGALSPPQRFGNRLATALIKILWNAEVTDLGPFRAITDNSLRTLQMADRQFGWTVEMQVKALQLGYKIVEVPVSTRKRIGQSKISGTITGVIGAGHGILGTIAKLYWRQICSRGF